MTENRQIKEESVPAVATQEEIQEEGVFNQTSRVLGWYQYFPESPIQTTQILSSSDQQMLFIVKLYLFLAGLFIINYIMIIIFYFSPSFRFSLIDFGEPKSAYYIILGCTIFLGFIAYFIKPNRKFPLNVVFYFVYSFGIGCVLASYSADKLSYKEEGLLIVLLQFCMSVCTFGTVLAFKFLEYFFTKSSYILLIVCLADIFVILIFIMTNSLQVWRIILSIILHVLYGVLLLFETKLIQRGKFNLKQDEYIIGALFIYIEVTIFIIFVVIFFIIFIIIAFISMIVAFIAGRK